MFLFCPTTVSRAVFLLAGAAVPNSHPCALNPTIIYYQYTCTAREICAPSSGKRAFNYWTVRINRLRQLFIRSTRMRSRRQLSLGIGDRNERPSARAASRRIRISVSHLKFYYPRGNASGCCCRLNISECVYGSLLWLLTSLRVVAIHRRGSALTECAAVYFFVSSASRSVVWETP